MTSLAELAKTVKSVAVELPLDRYFTAAQLREAALYLEAQAKLELPDPQIAVRVPTESSLRSTGEDSDAAVEGPGDSLMYHAYAKPAADKVRLACDPTDVPHHGPIPLIYHLEDQ